jgi:hypothetical protein
MLERFVGRKQLAGAALFSAGALSVTGCSGTTHGIAGLQLVNCQSGPKTNEISLATFPKGQSFQLGQNIKTSDNSGFDGDGFNVAGPLEVTSLGDGGFEIIPQSPDKNGVHPNESDIQVSRPNSNDTYILVVSNQGERYKLTGTPTGQAATRLVIDAACIGG